MGKFDKILKWTGSLEQSVLSLVKIVLMSRRPSPLPTTFTNPQELVILANGPSLKTTVADHRDFLSGKTLLAVNYAVNSPEFDELRPELYIIADPFFWTINERCTAFFGAIAQKTSWPMHLFVPVSARSNKNWQPLLAGNSNVKVCFYNATPIEGFTWVERLCYRRGLGVPRPHNVLIPSIATALRMPFEKIYLAGADHSWLHEITVTDDNEVLMNQKHFYDSDTSKAAAVKQRDLNVARLHTILYHMYTAFKAYFTLESYAASLGKQIYNITPESYIDAFPRLKL